MVGGGGGGAGWCCKPLVAAPAAQPCVTVRSGSLLPLFSLTPACLRSPVVSPRLQAGGTRRVTASTGACFTCSPSCSSLLSHVCGPSEGHPGASAFKEGHVLQEHIHHCTHSFSHSRHPFTGPPTLTVLRPSSAVGALGGMASDERRRAQVQGKQGSWYQGERALRRCCCCCCCACWRCQGRGVRTPTLSRLPMRGAPVLTDRRLMCSPACRCTACFRPTPGTCL